MRPSANTPHPVNSIAAFHELIGLPKPAHPLISVARVDRSTRRPAGMPPTLLLNLYAISLKKHYEGRVKYGQNEYDFDTGVMSFFSPGQVISNAGPKKIEHTGWLLIFHPDFLWRYPLAKQIRSYGFFSYALHEALHLSDKEESMVATLMEQIEGEYQSAIDAFSQNVMVSQLELLFNYADRFYNRQFITRKIIHTQLLECLESLLNSYFEQDLSEIGLPTAQFISQQLNLSANYLSDLLRRHTGQSVQQHIHNKLIEKAKEKISATGLSIGEIAYQLGFEHQQSFTKIFKRKTGLTPMAFKTLNT